MTRRLTVRTYDAAIHVRTHVQCFDRRLKQPGVDWETYNRLLGLLRDRGFAVGTDAKIARNYPTLARHYHEGARATPHGDLRFRSEVSPIGCSFTFFQEVNISNPNGGYCDFDKLRRMPYLIRKRFEGVEQAILDHLTGRGFEHEARPPHAASGLSIGRRLAIAEGLEPAATADDIAASALRRFNCTWDGEYERQRGVHRFVRDESGWPAASELPDYNRRDRDGAILSQGDIRYWRDSKGRLQRGVVYGGINGMWAALSQHSGQWLSQLAASQLFSSATGMARKAHPKPRTLASVLQDAIKAENFERAAKLRDLIRAQARSEAA